MHLPVNALRFELEEQAADCLDRFQRNYHLKPFRVLVLFATLSASVLNAAPPAANSSSTNQAALLTIEGDGKVEVARSGTGNWHAGRTNEVLLVGDRVRTGLRSRATVRLSNLTVLRVNELTTLQIQPPSKPGKQSALDLESGAAYFFSRERPTELEFRTPLASGAIRGTEFNLAVAGDGRTVVTLLDGAVALTNSFGGLDLASGEEATVEPGRRPSKTAVVDAVNIIQWCLYYPAVLDPDELNLSPDEKQALAGSLTAYRNGELLQALAQYPDGRTPSSDAEKVYWAELLLSVGQVEDAQAQLANMASPSPLADALKEVIAAVKYQLTNQPPMATTASQHLADSYWLQAQSKLPEALAAAQAAVAKSPNFGFGWERVAELEFSFGRTATALDALDKSLKIAPRNAQALALRGFLLAAQNHIDQAGQSFDEAIAIDGALDNAWLGRGLVRIRKGDGAGGVQDLQTAAVLAPRRSLLRSYLGKAFYNLFDTSRALRELALAQKLDPNDPTPWQYLALVQQQENLINPAITNLQAAQDRNDNRSVFRSRFLLDEDRAVASVNLAGVYRDDGMTPLSLREAARALSYDYSDDSAHLFISDSYNDLRDPTRFNLRYETVWFSELLLANILSPVGGGRLSQQVSQQEYSKLFESEGVTTASSSEMRSDGMFHEGATQFGNWRNSAYSFDLDYQHNDGVRTNNDLDSIEWYTTLKQQITPQDTALVLIKYENYHSGDNFQYYYPSNANGTFRYDENQEPIVVGAWHHEWGPGMHTLLLGGRLITDQHFSEKQVPQIIIFDGTRPSSSLDVNYNNEFTIYTAELNQICEWNRVTLVAGARYQTGSIKVQDQLTNPNSLDFLFEPPSPVLIQNSIDDDFERYSGYGYLTVRPFDRLMLTAGASYDEVKYPDNFRSVPVTPGDDKRARLGPKAALVWNPIPEFTLRSAYTRSLGGVSLDESYRLEPSQLAGFPQAFRSLISESLVGSVTAPTYETIGVAADLKLGPRTYAGVEVDRLRTAVRQGQGIFTDNNSTIPVIPAVVSESLSYEERAFSVNVNQILSDELVAGASFTLTRSSLNDNYVGVPTAILSTANPSQQSTLQVLGGYILMNLPSGFYTRFDTEWYNQQNTGTTVPTQLPDTDFFQENFYAGWRLFHRRADLRFGILNIGGHDYHLNPLTPYAELPRKRVFEGRINVEF